MNDTWGGLDPATFHTMTDNQRAMRRALWHHTVQRLRVDHETRYHHTAERRAALRGAA
jgi:hypothetical protein